MTEDCVFKNCEFYSEDVDGHCNGECCGGPAQECCQWYEYLQKDREIRKPKPTPDFDAIAREIEEEAFDSCRFNKSSKQYEGFFDRSECAEILRKHFGKEELEC